MIDNSAWYFEHIFVKMSAVVPGDNNTERCGYKGKERAELENEKKNDLRLIACLIAYSLK
jgi:hypothetical protein